VALAFFLEIKRLLGDALFGRRAPHVLKNALSVLLLSVELFNQCYGCVVRLLNLGSKIAFERAYVALT
jgi:hypothetical protein